ncbi:hypothetical protein [Methanoregula sp.]|uniref:hypothetical protein n=1 Tax=Methanoregula sp. TaxID=2052170 RepID=UPI000CC02FE9|nr:hypothetical protein [Methanoregula sp.]PKG33802.1 MAG: hypothetical protein CW742_01110 [Methanoregula sp.]
MKAEKGIFALSAILLLILFPLAAGCLSVPGPESQKKTPTVTAAVTRSPVTPAEVTTIVQRTVVTAPTAERTTAPLSPSVTTAAPVTRYAADTCTGQGGFLVLPGQGCSGAWLVSTNTFSCCSAEPVTVAGSTRSLSVVPFTLTVNIDDNLGSIHP